MTLDEVEPFLKTLYELSRQRTPYQIEILFDCGCLRVENCYSGKWVYVENLDYDLLTTLDLLNEAIKVAQDLSFNESLYRLDVENEKISWIKKK